MGSRGKTSYSDVPRGTVDTFSHTVEVDGCQVNGPLIIIIIIIKRDSVGSHTEVSVDKRNKKVTDLTNIDSQC